MVGGREFNRHVNHKNSNNNNNNTNNDNNKNNIDIVRALDIALNPFGNVLKCITHVWRYISLKKRDFSWDLNENSFAEGVFNEEFVPLYFCINTEGSIIIASDFLEQRWRVHNKKVNIFFRYKGSLLVRASKVRRSTLKVMRPVTCSQWGLLGKGKIWQYLIIAAILMHFLF